MLVHRDRETGEGVHARTGWTLGRGRLQLWRAGRIFTEQSVCCCFSVVQLKLRVITATSAVLSFAADASCAGVPEEHRQTVAHRYVIRLQWRQRGEISGLQVGMGPTGESQYFNHTLTKC